MTNILNFLNDDFVSTNFKSFSLNKNAMVMNKLLVVVLSRTQFLLQIF